MALQRKIFSIALVVVGALLISCLVGKFGPYPQISTWINHTTQYLLLLSGIIVLPLQIYWLIKTRGKDETVSEAIGNWTGLLIALGLIYSM